MYNMYLSNYVKKACIHGMKYVVSI